MVNNTTLKKLYFSLALLMILVVPGLTNASSIFSSTHSTGFLTTQEFAASIPEQNTAKNSAFFGTLGPDLSARGAVKTYAVRVVEAPKSRIKSMKKGSVAAPDSLVVSGKSLFRPVSGRISSSFGNRRHPKSRIMKFHSGIDIAARRGTPVYSSLTGKVSYAGWRRGYGLVVIIDHEDGLQTVYAHCSKLAVKAGQRVNTGQRIGYVGSTGVATGAHLHYEVRRDGNVRNPMRYLGG